MASLSTTASNSGGSEWNTDRASAFGHPKLREHQTFFNLDVSDDGTVNEMDVSTADFIHSNSLSFALVQKVVFDV